MSQKGCPRIGQMAHHACKRKGWGVTFLFSIQVAGLLLSFQIPRCTESVVVEADQIFYKCNESHNTWADLAPTILASAVKSRSTPVVAQMPSHSCNRPMVPRQFSAHMASPRVHHAPNLVVILPERGQEFLHHRYLTPSGLPELQTSLTVITVPHKIRLKR